MNIRDSYIHGADGKGVVKSLFFVTAADVQADNNLHLNDLGIILADANNSTFYLTIPTLNLNTTGYAALILTESKTNNTNYYITFVGSNNTNGAAALSVYTNVNIYFNPSEGPTGHKGTLHVNNISGDNIGITIGNTFVTLGETYTPVTSITASSTDDDIPSAAAVWAMLSSGLQANDAMIFKGVLNGGTNTTYTPAAECGHVYKVAVAGKINGDYYEVGDTLICAVDSTAAATSSNVSTVKANWYAIQTNIADYLLKTGGTMTGNLKWKDTTALPTINSMANANILVVDGMGTNTEGTTKQISLASLLSSMDLSPSIGAGTGTNTVKITVNGTDSSDYTIPYATSAANLTGGALGSIPYLTATGTTQFLAGGSNNLVLRYDGTNKKPYWGADVNTWRNVYVGGTSKVGSGTDTKAMNFASSNINITYLAAGTNTGQSGNANYFTINFEAKNWTGATSGTAGTAGYMPGAATGDRTKFLRGDGDWIALAPSISAGTTNTDKVKITIGGEDSNEFLIPNADKLDGHHNGDVSARYISPLEYTRNDSLDDVADGFGGWANANNPTNSVGNNAAFMQITAVHRPWDKFQLAFTGNNDKNIYFRSSWNNNNTTSWNNWMKLAHSGNISNKEATIETDLTTIATIAGVDITAKIGSYASSNHTHALSIATDNGTNELSLTALTKYKLTAGGSTFIFTTPDDKNVELVDNNDEEWRPILTKNGTNTTTVTSTTTFADGVKIYMKGNYLQATLFNTPSADMETTAMTKIYCSNDNYIRYKTLAQFTKDILALAGIGLVVSFDKTLTYLGNWIDTGISGNDLSTGTYVVLVYMYYSDLEMYLSYWSGVMSWLGSGTNQLTSDEISLHCASHYTGNYIYLRTLRTSLGHLKLQLACDTNFTDKKVTFKFRKLI